MTRNTPMLTTLILAEIRRNLLSQRFVIGLISVFLVYIGCSLIFWKKYSNEKEGDIENAAMTQASMEDASQSVEKLYDQTFRCAKYEELSGYFASGNESRLPNAMVVRASAPQGAVFLGGMAVSSGTRNYKIDRYSDFDLTFIIGVVLSFLAIVLSYDAVSRDREEGTLKQQLSNSLPRAKILLGKFAAIFGLLFVTMLCGSIISMIVFQIALGQNMLFRYPLEGLVGGILALLYLSAFIWLGLWGSAAVRTSSTSLALLLLAWVGLVILAPYTGGMLAQYFSRVRSQEEFNNVFQAAITAEQLPREVIDFMKGQGREEEWRAAEAYDERKDKRFEEIVVQRFNELNSQAEMAESLNFYSPYGAFRQTMERIAGTGLSYHKRFFQAARRYRDDLRAFVKAQDRLDDNSKHHIFALPQGRSISQKPVDMAIIPRFEAPPRGLSSVDIAATLPAIGYLAVLNIVLFGLAFIAFFRLDVR